MRKRFRFSLERVLGLRRLEERLRKADLAIAQGLLYEAEESKRKSQRAVAECQEALGAMRRLPSIPIADCLQTEALMNDLTLAIGRKERIILVRATEVERAREIYMAASTRRKAIEKLRETRLTAHRKENQKSESARFDALASERAFQSKTEES